MTPAILALAGCGSHHQQAGDGITGAPAISTSGHTDRRKALTAPRTVPTPQALDRDSTSLAHDPRGRRSSRSRRQPVTPTNVLTAFATYWTNWTGRTLAEQQRRDAELATGRLRDSLLHAADSSPAARGTGERGRLVAVTLHGTRAVVVTHEQQQNRGQPDSSGPRYRVYLARVRHHAGGWAVSDWQPQP